jgi:DNA primase
MSNNSLQELKQRIFDLELVEKLLESLGCEYITPPKKQPSGEYLVTAKLPDYPNKKAIQVYLTPNLHTNIVTCGISGNIFSLVAFILYGSSTEDEVRSNLYQIKTHICDLLGFDDLLNQKYTPTIPKVDWNYWLRPIQEARVRELDISDNEVLDEKVLQEFITYPWQNWMIEDGISWKTQNFFGIGFHVLTERVTIPVHNKRGELIGIKGRYVGCDPEQLESKKYNYIYSMAKSIELFNLFRAIPYILLAKKVIVVEAAKTVIKLWDWDIRNVVSIEGDRISPVQIKLLKELGLDIEIITIFDKDKDEEFVKKQLKQIKNRKTYYSIDDEDRFKGKESPADRTIEDYIELYNNKRLLS